MLTKEANRVIDLYGRFMLNVTGSSWLATGMKKNVSSGSTAMLIANVHCVRFVSGKLLKGLKLGTKDVCR